MTCALLAAWTLKASLVLVVFQTLPQNFRSSVRDGLRLENTNSGTVGSLPVGGIYLICAQYFVRKAGEAVSLLAISPMVCKSYFTNLWTVFDVLAIVLTVVATRLVRF